MGRLLYFGLLAVQLTRILATQPIPLKCFLRDDYILALFQKENVSASPLKTFTPLKNHPLPETLKVDSVKIANDGFLLEAKDIYIKGLNDVILDDFGINFKSNITYLILHSDILMKYLYKVDGSILFLPVNGEGVAETFIKNVEVGVIIPFDIIDTNGEKFIELKGYDYWYDTKGYAKFNASNLYYGDKERSDTLLYLLNQNWKFASTQYGKFFIDKVMEYMFNVFQNYYRAQPLRNFSTC